MQKKTFLNKTKTNKQNQKTKTKNKKKTMTNLYINAIPKVVFESVSIVCGS
jgi:hypothetical protein